jgi:hypothetical protein
MPQIPWGIFCLQVALCPVHQAHFQLTDDQLKFVRAAPLSGQWCSLRCERQDAPFTVPTLVAAQIKPLFPSMHQ